MDINIYVATQKKLPFTLPNCYMPIFVGAELSKNSDSLGYISDNLGENISNKNKSFCELTALYWIWKNDDSEVIGLSHYRRYLSLFNWTRNHKKIINEKKIEQLMNDYDLILPQKTCLWGTVEEQYSNGQYHKDYILCGEILKNLYPEYYHDFTIISKSDQIYICNMFIGKKKLIDDYCEWLFPILFELEKQIDISDYSISEARIFGYLSERLFNVWLLHSNVRVKEVYLLNTELKFVRRVIDMFHTFNYKVLHIDVMKYSARRVEKRKRNEKKQFD